MRWSGRGICIICMYLWHSHPSQSENRKINELMTIPPYAYITTVEYIIVQVSKQINVYILGLLIKPEEKQTDRYADRQRGRQAGKQANTGRQTQAGRQAADKLANRQPAGM